MGSLENWSSDEEDAIMDSSSRSRKASSQAPPRRAMNRSMSVFANLSEMPQSLAFGARWSPRGSDMNHSSDLREPFSKASYRDIDDDWSDEPFNEFEPASGADMDDNANGKWRQSMNADIDTGGGFSSSASEHTRSRPIAIPRSRQNSAASAITLPEPLSARGERQGGYFPFHEDPKTRVRHPHPFYHDIKSHEMAPSVEDVDTGADADVDMPKPKSPYDLSTSAQDDSYGFLSDDDDDINPFRLASMGKYYPSVWEKRHGLKKSIPPPATSSSKPPSTSKSSAPRTHKRRPRPKTPVIVPRLATATEPIPPFQLSQAE